MEKLSHFAPSIKGLRLSAVKYLALFVLFTFLSPFVLRPCTIAAVSGRATPDVRSLLWKNRDITAQDNVVRYFVRGKYSFIGVTQAGDRERVYAGINMQGFAILNSVSSDLKGDEDTDHGRSMKRVLEECATVEDFEMILMETNVEGSQNGHTNGDRVFPQVQKSRTSKKFKLSGRITGIQNRSLRVFYDKTS